MLQRKQDTVDPAQQPVFLATYAKKEMCCNEKRYISTLLFYFVIYMTP